MSAVSIRLIPSSRVTSMTARLWSRSARLPKLFAPGPTTETISPDEPRGRYLMSLIEAPSKVKAGRRYTSPHAGRRDPPEIPDVFRGTGTPRDPFLLAHRADPGPAADQRRDEPVRPVLPRAGEAPLCSRRLLPEGLPHAGHRPRGPQREAPHVLRDARELRLRRLLQGGSHPVRPRTGHRGLRDRQRPPVGHGLRVGRGGGPGLDRGGRAPAGPDRPSRKAGPARGARQLLVDARGRPLRAMLGDLRGPRAQVRP